MPAGYSHLLKEPLMQNFFSCGEPPESKYPCITINLAYILYFTFDSVHENLGFF